MQERFAKSKTGNRKRILQILWWIFALVLCLGAAAVRIWCPERLDALQCTVFGMDEERLEEVFSPQDKDVAVWIEDAEAKD